jgi:hypothetical protein
MNYWKNFYCWNRKGLSCELIFQIGALWKCVEQIKHQCDFALWTGYIVGSKAILEFEFDLDYQ